MSVDVVDESGEAGGDLLAAAAERAGELLLERIDRGEAELCVVLVDDEHIRELNRDWRGKDRPTDVLSFSQVEGEELESSPMLGDVVISVPTLRRQAADGGWSDEEELVRLLLHGILHLVGFDHEQAEDARAMQAEEARLVGELAAAGIGCAWDAR